MSWRSGPVAALLAMVLSACGSGGGGAAKRPEVLRLQAAGGEGELAAAREVADGFEAANPGVQVDFTGVAEQGDHLARLTTAFAAGNPPDAFLLNYRRIGAFVSRGVIDPVPRTTDVADFYPPPLEAFTDAGALQCLPQNASSSVVYVNETLFAEAEVPLPPVSGWSWEELRSIAGQLNAKGVEAIAFEPGLRTVAPFIWSAGGEVVDDQAAPTRITLDTAAAQIALGVLTELQKLGYDARQRAGQDPQDAFAAGQVAMLIDSRRAVPALRKTGIAFDVRPFPRQRSSASLLAADGWCVSKASKQRDLAHRFAAFTTGPVGGRVLAASGRTVPVARGLAESPAFLDPASRPRNAKVFLDAIPGLRRLPNVSAQAEAEETADDLLAQYFAERLGLTEVGRAVEKATAVVYAARR
jgi:multiple sugar transport system substrate-binding protein